MLENMWKVVKPEDDLWIIGDFAFGAPAKDPAYLQQIYGQLPGARKHLVVGNHDSDLTQSLDWSSISLLAEVPDGPKNQRNTLCHYPMITWNQARRETACADLARHRESYVASLGRLIAELDARRDLEHENQIVEKDAQISTQSAELKVVKSENRLLRARLSKLQGLFGGRMQRLQCDHFGCSSTSACYPALRGSSWISLVSRS